MNNGPASIEKRATSLGNSAKMRSIYTTVMLLCL